jgi:hypothetical protein
VWNNNNPVKQTTQRHDSLQLTPYCSLIKIVIPSHSTLENICRWNSVLKKHNNERFSCLCDCHSCFFIGILVFDSGLPSSPLRPNSCGVRSLSQSRPVCERSCDFQCNVLRLSSRKTGTATTVAAVGFAYGTNSQSSSRHCRSVRGGHNRPQSSANWCF